MRCCPRSVAIGLLLVAALPVGGEGAGSVNLPINDPRTESVERVALSGLVDTALLGTRPYSRMDAARIVAEALKNLDRLDGTETEFLGGDSAGVAGGVAAGADRPGGAARGAEGVLPDPGRAGGLAGGAAAAAGFERHPRLSGLLVKRAVFRG